MDKYKEVFENNRRWAAHVEESDPGFFLRQAAGQNPDFLYIGCADSRVPANVVMGLDPGDVFVHRNVANLVVNTDLNVRTVIEYAVVHLEVEHIVVCGHYGCGGVQAAMAPKDHGFLNCWLLEVRDVYRLHQQELDAIGDDETRYRRLVELNVQEQCVHVMKTASVQRALAVRGGPQVHGWVYDLHTGLLKDLNINVDQVLSEIREIYRVDA